MPIQKKTPKISFVLAQYTYIVSTYKFTVLTLWWFLCWQHKTSWKIYYKNVLRFFICWYCIYSSHYRDHAATILDDEFILFLNFTSIKWIIFSRIPLVFFHIFGFWGWIDVTPKKTISWIRMVFSTILIFMIALSPLVMYICIFLSQFTNNTVINYLAPILYIPISRPNINKLKK